MSELLKPCPFCGGKAELQYDVGSEVYGQSWVTKCMNCGVATGKAYGTNSYQKRSAETEARDAYAKREAVEAWNSRTQATLLSKEGDAK